MALPSKVINHSYVSPTIHFGTEWLTFKMALASEITRHCTVTSHPSRSMHAVNSLWNGVARDDGISNLVLPTLPSCAQWMCSVVVVLQCRFATHQLTHTLWSARMTGTPLRVCASSPLPKSGTLCCWLKQTPWRNSSSSGRLHFQWPIHIHRLAGCRMPCTPLRVCTPPQLPNLGQHHHWCWAEDSLADSTFTGQSTSIRWQAAGCRALPSECAHHPSFPIQASRSWAEDSLAEFIVAGNSLQKHDARSTPSPHCNILKLSGLCYAKFQLKDAASLERQYNWWALNLELWWQIASKLAFYTQSTNMVTSGPAAWVC